MCIALLLSMKVKALNGTSEVFLYGAIGWDINANDFLKELREQEAVSNEITVRINSGGGSMFEGLPMYNNLKASRALIISSVDGLCASMATIIMCGAKKVRAASNAMLMVHGPQGGDYSSIENLEVIIEYMKKMRVDMAKIYATKTGKPEQWILDNWLADGKDHWFTAQEAKDAGLVDEVYDAQQDAPQMGWPLQKIAAFYNDTILNFNKPTDSSMKKVIVELNATGLVGSLPDNATEELVASGVKAITGALGAKDQEITTLKKQIGDMQAAATADKEKTLKTNATTLVEAAASSGKIVAMQKDAYITLASASEAGFESVKKIFDGMKGYQGVNSQLTATDNSELPASKSARVAMFEKHVNEGTIGTLKAENIIALYEAANGKKPSESVLAQLTGK